MNIILFIFILGLLVFVHELGHFLFAKLFKIRVDEFGFGYPPKMFKMFSWKGTDFTMNWIPFGGFVKIFGESDDGKELSEEEKKVSLVYKPRWQQILVMLGGVLFNVIFAWMLFTGIFMAGVPAAVSDSPEYNFSDSHLAITSVLENSPADQAGLKMGDQVLEYYQADTHVLVEDQDTSDVVSFIQNSEENHPINFIVLRNGKVKDILIIPEKGVVGDNYSIGVSIKRIGVLKLTPYKAAVHAAKKTIVLTKEIGIGFIQLISGKLSMDMVSGPVGIVSQVGSAANIGIMYLVMFTAMLSLNLAVLNLVPFPALDGGRIFILIIESVIRKRLNPSVVNWINVIGFFILILLMLLVTVKDIVNLF